MRGRPNRPSFCLRAANAVSGAEMKRAAFIALALIVAGDAYAQDAAPLDIFSAIAGPESSFGQNLQNPRGTASGLFGFTASTFAQDLAGIGVDPAQYPLARNAPNSVQFAAAAYELNTRGISAWSCENCDPLFVRNVAQNGGIGAYTPLGNL